MARDPCGEVTDPTAFTVLVAVAAAGEAGAGDPDIDGGLEAEPPDAGVLSVEPVGGCWNNPLSRLRFIGSGWLVGCLPKSLSHCLL